MIHLLIRTKLIKTKNVTEIITKKNNFKKIHISFYTLAVEAFATKVVCFTQISRENYLTI